MNEDRQLLGPISVGILARLSSGRASSKFLNRVKIQRKLGRYRVMVDDKPWGRMVCCDLGGGTEMFETRFLWRARRAAAEAVLWLVECETPWVDVPEQTRRPSR